jgi:hypothetical protein
VFTRVKPDNYHPCNRLRRNLCALLLLAGSLLSGQAFTTAPPITATQPLTITLSGNGAASTSDPYSYYVNMLRLALEKTRATDGDFVITFHDHSGGIERDRAMLIAGTGIDAMWASVTRERAEKLRVIDVDLLKGLNNYRALLIHKNKKIQFSKVKTLHELKKFKTGSGPYWTDGIILKDNGFILTYGSNYDGLFKMLSLQRFDFFSRGLHEIHNDLLTYGDLGLVQVPHFLLKYDHPVHYCFFVNKNNSELADRIERGLLLAQADGSFDELFFSMPGFKYGYEILDDPQQHILVIHNKTNL